MNTNGWVGGSWGQLNENGIWYATASGWNVNNNATLRPLPDTRIDPYDNVCDLALCYTTALRR